MKYRGKGERSVEESARMVGLSLPTHGSDGGVEATCPPYAPPVGGTEKRHSSDH